MRMRILGCAFLLGLAVPLVAGAQTTGRITGVVTSEDGRPIPNAQLSVLSTSLLARTDSVGHYSISNVTPGAHTVRATSLGHAAGEVAVTVTAGGVSTANLKLTTVAARLDQVVVIGYGEQKRGEITSAVVSVDTTQFIQGPARDAASLIAGKVPGLAVTTPSGDPRAGTQISLRGVTTIQGSTNPLVLVDGVPGDLGTVSTPDIEAISVLKDGSAAAMYGSRASNGVILITTKRHRGNKPTLRYDGYVSQQSIYNRPDFLTADDYRRLIKQGYAFQDLGYSTDWEDALLRSPLSQRHNVSIGGGDVATNYTASLNYEKDQGIFLRSDNQEVTARGDIRHSMFSNKMDANFTFLNSVRNYFTGPDYNWSWRQALIRNPTDRMVDTATGLWQERGTYMYQNPLGLINEQNGNYEGRDTRLHGGVTYRPFETLRFSLTGGTDRFSSLSGNATTFKHVNTTINGQNGTASRSTSSSVDRILEGTGTYNNSFGRQDVTLLGGYSYQDSENEGFSFNTSEFPTDLFGYDALSRGAAITDGKAGVGSSKDSYKLIGFFGRLNYDWADKYLLMGSMRYEGNSRFGASHKWGLFPAVSAAWRLSSEPFIQKHSWISDLKLRAGYGVTGIAPTSSYLSLTSYSYGQRFLYNGAWVQGLAPARNPNPDLRWEEKHEINTGVDYALFNSRVTGSVDVYRRETRDMLYNYSVPVPPNLFGSILANVGTMRNNGVEAQLGIDVFRTRNLTWNTNFNWSHNTNMLESLSNRQFQTSDCFYPGGTGEPIQQSTHRVCVGEQIGDFFGWKSVDIDTSGAWIVQDTSGHNIPIKNAKAADRQVLGNGIPKQYAAWNNSVRYKNFDLDVNMRGAFSFQILNFQRMYYENPKILQYNMLKSAFDPVYGKRTVNYDLAYVSYYVEDGDYMKLDNVTLGYTLDQALVNRLTTSISGARFYLAGRNLLTLTGYKGMDPEVSTSGLSPGIDNRDQYPTTRMFTVGMTLSF